MLVRSVWARGSSEFDGWIAIEEELRSALPTSSGGGWIAVALAMVETVIKKPCACQEIDVVWLERRQLRESFLCAQQSILQN